MSNFFELFQKFSEFRAMIEKSNKNPMDLLDAELKKRNLSKKEVEDLIQSAKSFQQLFGVK